VNGTMDSVTGPQGTFAISLAHSTAAEVPLDTVIATLNAENGILTFDTLLARLPGVAANGEGTLGWRSPSDGRIQVDLYRRQSRHAGSLPARHGHAAKRQRAAASSPGPGNRDGFAGRCSGRSHRSDRCGRTRAGVEGLRGPHRVGHARLEPCGAFSARDWWLPWIRCEAKTGP
jgi:hypothetical protein